jgi:DNA-binding transcriptional LysR family regulator
MANLLGIIVNLSSKFTLKFFEKKENCCHILYSPRECTVLDHLETLAALAQAGTMTRAATRLRLTQSAVSKRIAALERETGHQLVEPQGRGVRLTPAGTRLLERTLPLMAALREALREEIAHQAGRLVLGVSESILASWGPPVLARVRRSLPRLELVINAHRSPVALERVRSGEYMLALCAGVGDEVPDLKAELLLEEPMVIVPSDLKPFRIASGDTLALFTIEPGSATWSSLERRLRRLGKRWNLKIEVARTLQSFAGIVQLARSGFGHGLVPAGVARALGLRPGDLVRLPAPGLTRPVSLVGRPTTLALPLVQNFRQALAEGLKALGNDLS